MNEDFAKLQQLEQMKKHLLKRILSKEAYERLARVRIANSQMANQLELYLMQMFQEGKLRDEVSDHKLKEILMILTEKRDIKIRRK